MGNCCHRKTFDSKGVNTSFICEDKSVPSVFYFYKFKYFIFFLE